MRIPTLSPGGREPIPREGPELSAAGGEFADGREASARALTNLLAGYAERNVDLAEVLDGLPYSVETLTRESTWLRWDDLIEVLERLEGLGGPETMRKVYESLAKGPKGRRVRASLSFAVSPKQLFTLLLRWMGPSLYPIHTATLDRLADGRLRAELTVPRRVRASEPFFRSTACVFEVAPTLLGLPAAHVEAHIEPHAATYWITPPPSGSFLSRFKRVAQVFTGARSAIEELAEQQAELRRSYDALADSFAALRERERLLEAEVEERKRAEEALRRSEAKLLRSQRMEAMGRLAGGIAHDFNNLMTTVLGYADELDDPKVTRAELDEGLCEIRRAAERATRLTGQLLAFSRRQVLKLQALDLNHIVREMESMLRRVLGEDVEVRTELEADLPGVVADPSQLEQVLLNLAVNARDAMAEGGTLTLRTSRGRSGAEGTAVSVRLRVEDSGQGISEDVRPHIFEPFFTTKETGQGTGLGLSTVYGIVRQSGGRIEVESQPGAGAAFVIDLPAATSRPTVRGPAAPIPEASGGAETVLVVEDEDSVRSLIKRVLSGAGYRVLEAASGDEAEAGPWRQAAVDLVVTDVVMRGTSGPELARRLREERSDLPVLLISGYPGNRVDLDASFGFLAKPFSKRELLARVRTLLDDGGGD